MRTMVGAAMAAAMVVTLLGSIQAEPSRKTVLPHDTCPGTGIFKLPPGSGGLRMLQTGFNDFFTVLNDGQIMTTSDLSPLVNRPVNLVVLEEASNETELHSLELYVLARQDMLTFPEETYEGEVPENSPGDTAVSGVPPIRALGGGVGGLPVRYSIISGNDDGAFRLVGNDSSGVWLVTEMPLDREKEATRKLVIQAADGRGVDRATTVVNVNVLDENDNSPVFKQPVYRFSVPPNLHSNPLRFPVVGKVEATDADGDKVAFRLITPSNAVVIVPQTGEILLTGDPLDTECEIRVEAHDVRSPSKSADISARVWLQFTSPVLIDDNHLQVLHRERRRVTRAVRPTKRIDFPESDGETEGRVVFQLEKETDRETFKIRDENPWVTVEPNGSVRVKKKWDYEELGPEKSIDFWVTITNNGNGGKFKFQMYNIVLSL